MKKSAVAVMLSALVFPGLGHLYLKRWRAGVVLMGVAASATYFIFVVSFTIVSELSMKIQSGAIPADFDTVASIVSQQLAASAQGTNVATIVLLVCWGTGVVSVYLQGRALERADTIAQHP